MLIVFPTAFFSGALFFDVMAVAGAGMQYAAVAYYLLIAGVVTGLAAAIPGFIDFLYTVPPRSSGRKRAAIHGLLNVCMIALFATAWMHRTVADTPVTALYLGLEVVGTGLMMTAGWMGGTLVHRNQIGVDHRYAFAGKWREAHLTEQHGQVDLGGMSDLQRDQMALVHVGDRRIVVARTEEGWVAFDDRCTHRGGSLAAGMMICGTVQCPWHGSQFGVRTGAVKAGPATTSIPTYAIEQRGNDLYLNLGGKRRA